MPNILSGVLSGVMFIIIGHPILTGYFEKNKQKPSIEMGNKMK